MLKMNKKAVKNLGQLVLHLSLLLIVIVTFFPIVSKIQDNKLHEMRVEVIDYKLTRDALTASPYKLDYTYKTNENITLSFNEENCIVEAKYKDETVPLRSFCSIDQFADLKQQQSGKDFRFTK